MSILYPQNTNLHYLQKRTLKFCRNQLLFLNSIFFRLTMRY